MCINNKAKIFYARNNLVEYMQYKFKIIIIIIKLVENISRNNEKSNIEVIFLSCTYHRRYYSM